MKPEIDNASQPLFSHCIELLRQQEELILYQHLFTISEEETLEVGLFLGREYQKERLEYPFEAPEFDVEAAIWGAKTVYISAQLILFRKDAPTELERLLPDFSGKMSPSAMLSADLCLRFLPDIVKALESIDPHDPLMDILMDRLTKWHYSGIKAPLKVEAVDFQIVKSNACLHQLYVNRIIHYKNRALANHPEVLPRVLDHLGLHPNLYWKNFEITHSNE